MQGASRGLACFLVPRVLDDGRANEGFRVMRLKNKIGDRSNASSEVEYHDAIGFLIGEHGRGVKTIMEMVALTRLDCATGSAGIMRSAVFSAGLHVSQRKAFGKTLLHQHSMAAVLADLEVECEAATHMSLAAAAALGADAGELQASACVCVSNCVCEFVCGVSIGNVPVIHSMLHFVISEFGAACAAVFDVCLQGKRAQRLRGLQFPSASAAATSRPCNCLFSYPFILIICADSRIVTST